MITLAVMVGTLVEIGHTAAPLAIWHVAISSPSFGKMPTGSAGGAQQSTWDTLVLPKTIAVDYVQ